MVPADPNLGFSLHLMQELSEHRARLRQQERETKEELVKQARHNQAFSQIRVLLDWAATPPPLSARASGSADSHRLSQVLSKQFNLDDASAPAPNAHSPDVLSNTDQS